MERKIFTVTTIICLITFFGIIAGASAETIDIEGPWLWMIGPVPFNKGGADSIDFDSLHEASGGMITEATIADDGANVGDFVGETYQWTPEKISLERPGVPDWFGDGNINDTLNAIGFIEGNVDHATSYALLNIESSVAQAATIKVGSDDAIKVWLNGVVVHTNAINRSTTDYQDAFGVNLNAGDNLLMVKVSEQEKKWRMFVGLDVPDTDTIALTLPENVDIDTESVVGAGGKAEVGEGELRNSFDYHKWRLPTKDGNEDVFTDVAVTDTATYFVWKPKMPVPEGNSIPYKSRLTLLDLGAIKDYQTARQLYNNNTLPTKYSYFMVPLPTETPQEAAIDADQIFTWWGVVKSFFRNIWESVLGSVIDETIDALDQKYPKMKFNVLLTAAQVIYTTTQEALENYRAEKSAFNLITIALQDPSVTVEEYSQFMSENIADNNREARYLVMVPEKLTELTMRMETHYYRQSQAVGEGVVRLMIREDNTPGGNIIEHVDVFNIITKVVKGDMHLFWSGVGSGKILLNVPNKNMSWWYSKNWNEMTLRELLAFWVEGHGQTDDHAEYWDTWVGEWVDNDDTISDADKADITQRLLGTLKVWKHLTLGSIPLYRLFEGATNPSEDRVLNLFDVYFSNPTLYMFLPKYEAVPELPIVTHHEFQFESAAGAPSARPMSLEDYPPFQELSPEVQALLLRYLEETPRPEAVALDQNPIPEETSLLSNYPNPFNPETWIPYQLSEPADVTLTIYDIHGRVVRALDLGHQRAGMYHSRSRAAHWDGRNAVGEPVASGLYFYTLKAGDFTATRKMLIRK